MSQEKEKISEGIALAVLKASAKFCKTTIADIRNKTRKRFVVEARQLTTAILKEGGWCWQEIADFLTYEKSGNHTNPMHWYKMHQRDVKTYNYYRCNYMQLQSINCDTVDEFQHFDGKLISVDMYNNLEARYYNLKSKHDMLLQENKKIKSSANILKSQLTALC
tara:strand:- start:726 stop:1217 length:492 start_codon:yes stop_codon:yes gene_type:complete